MLLAERLQRFRLRKREYCAGDRAHGLAELVGPPHSLTAPERHRSRYAGSRRDEHSVARDLLDPPRRGAEQKGLTGSGLVDHLLVELSDPAPAVDQVHAEEAAVGDCPRVGDGEAACSLPTPDDAGRPVPDDPRPQLCELVRRVAAGEHVQDILELDARELGEGIGLADELVELTDLDLVVGADRDDLLREHV